MKKDGEVQMKTDTALANNQELFKLFMDALPQLGPNWHRHSSVGLKVEAISRILYWKELYDKILNVPGVICEFGVQYGASMATLINLRSIFEPFNHSRTIVGFDTFEGFPSIDEKDGDKWKAGDYSTGKGYENILTELLQRHEESAPMSHIKKHELVKGDISKTFPDWLDKNEHAIISMAIFDTDLYQPTKDVLNIIKPRLTKGSVLVFDELNCQLFPGETIAVREIIGTDNLRLRRTPLQPYCSWAVWGE